MSGGLKKNTEFFTKVVKVPYFFSILHSWPENIAKFQTSWYSVGSYLELWIVKFQSENTKFWHLLCFNFCSRSIERLSLQSFWLYKTFRTIIISYNHSRYLSAAPVLKKIMFVRLRRRDTTKFKFNSYGWGSKPIYWIISIRNYILATFTTLHRVYTEKNEDFSATRTVFQSVKKLG